MPTNTWKKSGRTNPPCEAAPCASAFKSGIQNTAVSAATPTSTMAARLIVRPRFSRGPMLSASSTIARITNSR